MCIDIQYLEILCELYNDLPFLDESTMIEKVEKHAANVHKAEYVVHIINSKEALNHGLDLKNGHRSIKFNQNPRLKLI